MSISITDIFPYRTNHIEGFDRLHHTRKYFATKKLSIPKFKIDLKGSRYDQIRDYCGYKNMTKFLEHVAQWNTLKKPVPVHYMEAIGIDFNTLEFTLELDREAYQQKILEPRYPGVATVKSGPIVISYELPRVHELDAIAYVEELIGDRKAPFYITYTDFLVIKILRGEEPLYYYRVPHLVRKGNRLSFTL